MIKTHNKTGLKYLCITKTEKWKEYPGSGVYWRRHLNKHGYNFSTELLFETDNYPDFLLQCEYYSIYYNVVLSEEFANLKPELGYDGFNEFWKYASEDVKKEIYDRRAISLKKNWDSLSEEERKKRGQIISDAYWKEANKFKSKEWEEQHKTILELNKKKWYQMTLDERREATKVLRQGLERFFANKESEAYKNWYEKHKNGQWANMRGSFSGLRGEELGKQVSKWRLGLSNERKNARKEKILAWHKEHAKERQALYDRFKEERKGINNPAAKKILWHGEVRLYREVCWEHGQKNVEALLKNDAVEDCKYFFDPDKLKDYGEMICPYCGKFKPAYMKPSAFKRWHFENCKKKGEANEKVSQS
jgi:hypothetical protein